jgi:hypothetical protein
MDLSICGFKADDVMILKKCRRSCAVSGINMVNKTTVPVLF